MINALPIMKSGNTHWLESYTDPGSYKIVINGDVISNYLYYLHMMIGFQPSVSVNKAQEKSTLTGVISNREKFSEVINTILEHGYKITSINKV